MPNASDACPRRRGEVLSPSLEPLEERRLLSGLAAVLNPLSAGPSPVVPGLPQVAPPSAPSATMPPSITALTSPAAVSLPVAERSALASTPTPVNDAPGGVQATTEGTTAAPAEAVANLLQPVVPTIAASASTTIAPVVQAVAPIVQAVATTVETATPAIVPPETTLAPIVQTVESTTQAVAPVVDTVAPIVAPVAQTVEDTTQAVAPVVSTVAPIAAPIVQAVDTTTQVVAPVADTVAPVVQPTTAPIVQAVDTTTQELTPIVDATAPALEAISPAIIPAVDTTTQAVTPVVETVAPTPTEAPGIPVGQAGAPATSPTPAPSTSTSTTTEAAATEATGAAAAATPPPAAPVPGVESSPPAAGSPGVESVPPSTVVSPLPEPGRAGGETSPARGPEPTFGGLPPVGGEGGLTGSGAGTPATVIAAGGVAGLIGGPATTVPWRSPTGALETSTSEGFLDFFLPPDFPAFSGDLGAAGTELAGAAGEPAGGPPPQDQDPTGLDERSLILTLVGLTAIDPAGDVEAEQQGADETRTSAVKTIEEADEGLGTLIPQLAGLLAGLPGVDLDALEGAVRDLLDEGGKLGEELFEMVSEIDLSCWLMAAAVTAGAYEIARRDLRRRMRNEDEGSDEDGHDLLWDFTE